MSEQYKSMVSPPCNECGWFDSGKCYVYYDKSMVIILNSVESNSYCREYMKKPQDD